MKSWLPVLMLAALCGGCETVVFEAPPVGAQACDPALVGNWLSTGDDPEEAGEVELRIDARCSLLFVEHGKAGTNQGESTELHVGRDGRIAYAWVDAQWAENRMELSDRTPGQPAKPSDFAAGDIVLMQYRASEGKLELRQADPKLFAHRIIDGRIKGEVKRDAEGSMAVRVRAPVDPKSLRDSRLFPRGEMRFVRAVEND